MKARPGIVIALFQKHANRVRRTLGYRLRDEEDGKDAMQETFLRLWRQERDGNLREDAVAYLNATAGTMALEFYRRRAASHAALRDEEIDADELPSSSPDVDESLHWRDAVHAFAAGVASLPRQTRDIFLLHHLKGLTYPQIADRLRVSTRTVERHMEDALLKLHRRVKEYL